MALIETITSLKKRLEVAEAKQKKIDNRRKRSIRKKERIDDTRRKILVGAIVLSKIDKGEVLILDKKTLLDLLFDELTREPDLALFFAKINPTDPLSPTDPKSSTELPSSKSTGF